MEHGAPLNRHAEDVIEENGEETLPHEAFYSAVDPDYATSKQPFVPQSVQIAKQNAKYTPMGVTPGPAVRGCIDVFSFILALAVLVLQLGLIDYYYIRWTGNDVWYAWIGGDALVIIIFIWLIVLAIKKNQESMEETSSADSRVRYAWIAWFFYSLLLIGKIATCFRTFYHEFANSPRGAKPAEIFDESLFRLGLCLSAIVFIFLLEAHHYTPLGSPRQLYITYLMTAITLDLLDTVSFIDLIWLDNNDKWALPSWLSLVVLCIGCANFFLPTFALLKLRFARNQRVLAISDRVWSFLYVLLVNGPFLGFRIYIYILLTWLDKHQKDYDPSIFAVKNIAMIYIALRELWVRLHYWRQKRGATGSRGQLTAAGATDQDEN